MKDCDCSITEFPLAQQGGFRACDLVVWRTDEKKKVKGDNGDNACVETKVAALLPAYSQVTLLEIQTAHKKRVLN